MLKASLVLSLALLAGRLAGLLRETGLAAVFGVGPGADAAVLLLTLPDLFVNLLLSGGLSAALVPHMSALGGDAAGMLWRQATLLILAVFGLLGLLFALWPQGVLGLLAPGARLPFGAGDGTVLAVALALPLTGAAGVAGAYLNAGQRFFVTGCGTLLFNGAVLWALWQGHGGADPLALLAAGIAAGAALRWGAQLLTVPAAGWRARVPGPVADRALARAFAAAAAASALMLLAPLVVRAMASLLGAGAIASFNYAQKLVELPIGILITSLSTVALARLAALRAAGRGADLASAARAGTAYALLLALAVTALGVWFADAAVTLVFGRGQMDGEALARVARLTRVALLSVPCVALSSMATARLYACQQGQRILLPSAACLLLLAGAAALALAFGSESWLMGAAVLFQAALAVWLSALAGVRLRGPQALLTAADGRVLAAIGGAAALTVALDLLLAPRAPWLRVLLAGCGFALALLPLRLAQRAGPGALAAGAR